MMRGGPFMTQTCPICTNELADGAAVCDACGYRLSGSTQSFKPVKMTADEMKKLCIDELKMSEYQAERATVKAVKIESQVRSQLEERAVAKDGVSKEMHIERKTDLSFTISMGDMSKSYNFGTINVEKMPKTP